MHIGSHAKLAFALSTLLAAPGFGQGLQQSLGDLDVGDRWQYNDWESAKAAAAKSKKPIFALFR